MYWNCRAKTDRIAEYISLVMSLDFTSNLFSYSPCVLPLFLFSLWTYILIHIFIGNLHTYYIYLYMYIFVARLFPTWKKIDVLLFIAISHEINCKYVFIFGIIDTYLMKMHFSYDCKINILPIFYEIIKTTTMILLIIISFSSVYIG